MSFAVNGTTGITFNDNTNMATAASLGPRNRIINGNMGIWQRGTSLAVPLNLYGNYIVDRFAVNNSVSTAAATISQSTDVPLGVAQYSALLTVTATQSTVNSGNFYGFYQGIEGYNIADLAYGTASAKILTLSFWVKSSVTGTFVANMYQTNSTNSRVFPYTYTISSANTWTYVTVTIPGDTVPNALPLTNSASFFLYWYTMLSSSYANGALNTWNANTSGNQYGGSSTGVNLFATSGATFYITGVQLEVGSVATPYQFNIYSDQLVQCQRYFTKSYDTLVVPGTATTTGLVYAGPTMGYYPKASVSFVVEMRTAPTISYWDSAGNPNAVSFISNTSGSTTYTNNITPNTPPSLISARGFIIGGNGSANGNNFVHYSASAEL